MDRQLRLGRSLEWRLLLLLMMMMLLLLLLLLMMMIQMGRLLLLMMMMMVHPWCGAIGIWTKTMTPLWWVKRP